MSYQKKKKVIKPHVFSREPGESDEHFKLRKRYTSLTWKNPQEKRKILKKLEEFK